MKTILENKNISYIQKTIITYIGYSNGSIMLDYDLNVDPRFNHKITDILNEMNLLYATPNNTENDLLKIELPFSNLDGSIAEVQVPRSTSQFQSK